MNAHAADPFARDRAIRQHLDAVRALLRPADTADKGLRDIIETWQELQAELGKRQPCADAVEASADWLAKDAEALSEYFHGHAATIRRG